MGGITKLTPPLNYVMETMPSGPLPQETVQLVMQYSARPCSPTSIVIMHNLDLVPPTHQHQGSTVINWYNPL
jgi:hypothetical protein